MTTAQVALIRPGNDSRQARRRIVNFAAIVEAASEPLQSVQIKDLSERGCRASVEGIIEENSFLMLKLPGMEAIRARVVWSSGTEIGCVFEEQLHTATIDHVLGRRSTNQRPVVKRRGVFGLKAE